MTSPTYSPGEAGSRSPLGDVPIVGPILERASSRARHAGDDDPWEVGTLGEVGSAAYDMGAILFDVLSLPGTAGPGPDRRWNTEDDTDGIGPETVFTWTIDPTGRQGQATQMTLAGALSWLKNLASRNRDEYNYIARLLVESGYIGPEQVRYGSYTNEVAAAFLQSVIDVSIINQDDHVGQATTWMNHIDSLIEGAYESGNEAGGAGGGGGGDAQPPLRRDVFSDESTLRAVITNAARNALGRSLTDAEEAAFVSEFRGAEQQWNDQSFAAEMATFNGSPSTVTDAPNPGVAADNFIDSHHSTESNAQAFGSYMGVLRRMVGLGDAGIGGNIA
jgi:hypothetical protein